MTPDLLGAIFTAQPLCRECEAPAYFRFSGSPLCVEHFNSVIATGSASSGDEVAAGVGQPPAVAPAVTDPFESCGGVEGHARVGHPAPYGQPASQCMQGNEFRAAGFESGPQEPFSKNATAFLNRALNSIEPKGVQVSDG